MTKLMSLGGLYRYLGMLFYLPDKDELKTLGTFDFISKYTERSLSRLKQNVKMMQDSFNTSSEEELRIEFSKLFIGPYELVAPPYGSVYLDRQGLIQGPSTTLVKKCYERHNLHVELKGPPDHIAIELEFIGILMQTNQSVQVDEELLSFFQDLFEPWIEPFCDRIIKGTKNKYFICLAKLLKDVTESTSVNIHKLRTVIDTSN